MHSHSPLAPSVATTEYHPRQRRSRFLALAVLVGFLASLAILLAGLGPAQAQDAYRYWTYWNSSAGEWTYAQTGATDVTVADGAVEGWLLQVTADVTPERQPAIAPDFTALCPGTSAPAGQISVAVVIDYGTAADAPDGEQPPASAPQVECLTLAEGSTGQDALVAAEQVRIENGAVCGIGGYPAQGCFDAAPLPAASDVPSAVPADATETAEETEEDSNNFWAGLAVAAALVAVAILAIVLVRRRRNQQQTPTQ